MGMACLCFLSTLALRTWGIDTRFLLLGDQMRDWSIALQSFTDLPLVGPATHVHGYTIGPAFYWILWGIRVSLGPWFEHLPHAGGIGHAVMHSGADALLLVAIWRRTRSAWVALATVALVATAPFDLSLSALVWNPVMGTAVAKMAMALLLLDWHRGSAGRVAVLSALAWSAVHIYTGAVFVTVSVFAAVLADPFVRREHQVVRRNALILVLVVACLQVPYVVHQVKQRFDDPAMGAVTGSVARVLSGDARPEFSKSLTGYVDAVHGIHIAPWRFPVLGWALALAAAVVAVRWRQDTVILALTLLPPFGALVGYALFLAGLDSYYYLSLMPSAVLTVVLALTAWPWPLVARGAGVAILAGALTIVPARYRHAMTMAQMPLYGAVVDASRTLAQRGVPMREIRTQFRLEPTSDPAYIYRLLGGRIDPASPWVAVITPWGGVAYLNEGDRP